MLATFFMLIVLLVELALPAALIIAIIRWLNRR